MYFKYIFENRVLTVTFASSLALDFTDSQPMTLGTFRNQSVLYRY